jgi:cytochrome c-type protein NapC
LASALFVLGICFWGAFNWSLEASNTEDFCISCHEMNEFIYTDFKDSVHYLNSSGVRATCPDCHVPREWHNMVIRKVGASNELFHWLAGSINTKEKFLAKRLQLAEHVWEAMEANDSLECRNCHQLEAMSGDQQSSGAREAHARAEQQQQTCIDCHKGIAHQLPEAFLDAEHDRFEAEKVPCSNCHVALNYGDDGEDW